MNNKKAYRHWYFLSVILLFSYSTLAISAPPEGYQFHNLTEAMKLASSEKKPMFLYFGRYGCSTCRKMHKEVFSDSALTKQLEDNFILAYVDTESDARIRLPNGERTTEMQFAARNRILGTPTFIYFSEHQEPLFKKAGFQTVQQMSDFNRFVAEGHYRNTTLKQYLAAK
jgi:thioredoxin-related protein